MLTDNGHPVFSFVLVLDGEPITRDQLAELNAIPNLERLQIDGDWGREGWDERPLLGDLDVLDGLRKLELWGCDIGSEGMSVVARIPELRDVAVWGTEATDRAFGPLHNVPNLRSIRLRDCPSITGQFFEYVSNAQNLDEVCLTDTSLSERGVRALAELPALERLWFDVPATVPADAYEGFASSEALSHVAMRGIPAEASSLVVPFMRNPQLIYLDCFQSDLDSETVARIAENPRLEYVGVSGSSAPSSGDLRALLRLPNLRGIDVSGCAGVDAAFLQELAVKETLEYVVLTGCDAVDDAAVASIANLPKLEYLDLSACPVTREGVDALKEHPTLRYVNLQASQFEADGPWTWYPDSGKAILVDWSNDDTWTRPWDRSPGHHIRR